MYWCWLGNNVVVFVYKKTIMWQVRFSYLRRLWVIYKLATNKFNFKNDQVPFELFTPICDKSHD